MVFCFELMNDDNFCHYICYYHEPHSSFAGTAIRKLPMNHATPVTRIVVFIISFELLYSLLGSDVGMIPHH